MSGRSPHQRTQNSVWMSVCLDLNEVSAWIDDHQFSLLYGLALVGNGGRLHHQRGSGESRRNRLPFFPSNRGTEVPCPWHGSRDTRGIVLKRDLGTEHQCIRKRLCSTTDVGAKFVGVEIHGFLEITNWNREMEDRSHVGAPSRRLNAIIL